MKTRDMEVEKLIRKIVGIGSAAFLVFVFGLAALGQAGENSKGPRRNHPNPA